MRRAAIVFFTSLLMASLWAGSAYAYIDPGAEGRVLQAIVGEIAAGFAVVGLYLSRLKTRLHKLLFPRFYRNREGSGRSPR